MIVLGAGGHALEILDILIQDNYPHPIFFYDDLSPDLISFRGYPVLKSESDVKAQFKGNFYFIIGVGKPFYREVLYKKFTQIGGILSSVISSKAVYTGQLVQQKFDLMNLCYLGPETDIGEGTLINTGAQIHHEVKVGRFCEISPRALLLGKVLIGDYCSIGGNATILPKVKLGNNVIVGAGSVVTKDVSDNKIVMGVPGKIIEN